MTSASKNLPVKHVMQTTEPTKFSTTFLLVIIFFFFLQRCEKSFKSKRISNINTLVLSWIFFHTLFIFPLSSLFVVRLIQYYCWFFNPLQELCFLGFFINIAPFRRFKILFLQKIYIFLLFCFTENHCHCLKIIL